MSEIHFGGVTIPSQQTLAPATHDDIAFRPACSQLVPIQREDWIFWTVTLSDGEQRVLETFPPMAVNDAYLYLDAHGLCKLGGVEVPLVYADQVPQRQVAQVTTTPELPAGAAVNQAGQNVQTVTSTAPSAGLNWLPMAIGAPILLLVAWLFVRAVRGSHRKPSKTAPKGKQGDDRTSALNDIFGGGQR